MILEIMIIIDSDSDQFKPEYTFTYQIDHFTYMIFTHMTIFVLTHLTILQIQNKFNKWCCSVFIYQYIWLREWYIDNVLFIYIILTQLTTFYPSCHNLLNLPHSTHLIIFTNLTIIRKHTQFYFGHIHIYRSSCMTQLVVWSPKKWIGSLLES